jgi:hypothetical protein
MKKHRELWIMIFPLVALFCLAFFGSRDWSLTYDEPAHFQYGMQILQGNSERFDDSKMPFSALNAIPARVAAWLAPQQALTVEEKIALGRVVTILFSLAVAGLVFNWSKALYGLVPAFFVLFLYILEPNLIAHASLVTSDIYAIGMITVSVYALWRYAHRRSWQNALWLALAVGASQLAKYTSIYLYPLLAGMLLIHDGPDLYRSVKARGLRGAGPAFRQYLLLALLVIIVSLLVINIGFLFNRTLTPFGDYEFKSSLFQGLQARLALLNRVPVPTPYPYLQGLDWVWFNDRTGGNHTRIYLLGQLSETGFKGYYLVAYLFKSPIAIQILLIAAVITFLKRFHWSRFLDHEWFLLAPVLFFGLYFNLFFRTQIGIRFYLVIFPFLLIFTGSLLVGWRTFKAIQWTGVAALSAYLVLSVASYYPHTLSYFNELVLDRTKAYKILADSNLDWGQANHYFEQYRKEHPDIIPQPDKPTSGRIVVSVNNLVGITAKPETYAWLRENYDPVGTVGYALLVYEVEARSEK